MLPDYDPAPIELGALRGRLLQRARRLVGGPAQADDLVQDALLAAWVSGRDWSDASTERWMAGLLWRRAAFLRRTAARRRAREHRFSESLPPPASAAPNQNRTPLSSTTLPPSLQIVARLAEGGCSRAEIAWVLGIRPDALRQRISALRQRLHGTEPPRDPLRSVRPGPVRQAVLPHSKVTGQLGSHDPDGYPILVGCSRPRVARQL